MAEWGAWAWCLRAAMSLVIFWSGVALWAGRGR